MVLAKPLLEDPDVFIVVPLDRGKKGFITRLLALLPWHIDPSRILYYDTDNVPDVRLRVTTLYVLAWHPVTTSYWQATQVSSLISEMGTPVLPPAPVPVGLQVYSLVPQSVLLKLRLTFVRVPPIHLDTVIFITRKRERMRILVSATFY